MHDDVTAFRDTNRERSEPRYALCFSRVTLLVLAVLFQAMSGITEHNAKHHNIQAKSLGKCFEDHDAFCQESKICDLELSASNLTILNNHSIRIQVSILTPLQPYVSLII